MRVRRDIVALVVDWSVLMYGETELVGTSRMYGLILVV